MKYKLNHQMAALLWFKYREGLVEKPQNGVFMAMLGPWQQSPGSLFPFLVQALGNSW